MPKKRNVNNIPDIKTRSGRSGKGFGSVDAAYRRVTGRKRQKPKITSNYYAVNKEEVNSMMRKLYRRQGR